MLGNFGLIARIALWALAGAMAQMGVAEWDATAGILTLDVGALADLGAATAAGFVAFAWRKWTLRRGGKT